MFSLILFKKKTTSLTCVYMYTYICIYVIVYTHIQQFSSDFQDATCSIGFSPEPGHLCLVQVNKSQTNKKQKNKQTDYLYLELVKKIRRMISSKKIIFAAFVRHFHKCKYCSGFYYGYTERELTHYINHWVSFLSDLNKQKLSHKYLFAISEHKD